MTSQLQATLHDLEAQLEELQIIEEFDQRLVDIRQKRYQLEEEEGLISLEQSKLVKHWYQTRQG